MTAGPSSVLRASRSELLGDRHLDERVEDELLAHLAVDQEDGAALLGRLLVDDLDLAALRDQGAAGLVDRLAGDLGDHALLDDLLALGRRGARALGAATGRA